MRRLNGFVTIGFTGRRDGMSGEQKLSVAHTVKMIASQGPTRAVHGDCVGADEEFDALCQLVGIPRGIRPCTFGNMRARCDLRGAEVLARPLPPMARNRAIVADSNILIACPPNTERIKKGSGTWATIGFGEKRHIPVIVVFPDGSYRDG